jgi:endo-1,4-beta-xylanase
VIEVGWGVWLEKSKEGIFNFSLADQAVDLALANGMTVEGDDLIYGGSDFDYSYMGQIEERLKAEGLNDQQIKERIEGIVRNHIQTIVTHYKGRITEWSVLNEWRGQNTEYPDFYSRVWNKAGSTDDDFVKMVFQTARESDPSARLFYNDNDINTPKQYGYPYAFSKVQMLRELGLIDAVGIQMTDIFVANPPDQDKIMTSMRSWGIPVIVSSATFQVQNMTGNEEEIWDRQADVAVQMLDACIRSGVCKDFRMWDGYGDKFAFQGPDARSTIFDVNMKPKPAYFAIKNYLTQMIDQDKK